MENLELQIRNLGMGEFSTDEQIRINELLHVIDLDSDTFISEYGSIQSFMKTHNILEQASNRTVLNSLANCITSLVAQMNHIEKSINHKSHNPIKVWFMSLLGPYELEQRLKLNHSTFSFESVLRQGRSDSTRIKQQLSQIDSVLSSHSKDVSFMRCHIAAGRLFLVNMPEAGVSEEMGLSFTNVRERFERRITNLAALLASHDMSYTQMKLSKAQMLDMLDRFAEVSEVLIPIWHLYQSMRKSGDKESPETIATANRVHEALIRSLAKTTKSMNGND